jgi:hypothetical protein
MFGTLFPFKRSFLMRYVALTVCLVASALSVASIVHSQDKKNDGKAADMHRAELGYFTSFGGVNVEDKPEARRPTDADFLWWKHRSVISAAGRKLNVRATAISVYVSDCQWNYSVDAGSQITSPAGNGQMAGNGWAYPNGNQFGILIRQGNNYWQINGTTPGAPTQISGLTNTDGVWVSVNDTNGNYGDNWGAFDVNIRVDAQ